MLPFSTALRNPVRFLMDQFRRPTPPPAGRVTTKSVLPIGTSILDAYCTQVPTPQTALDIFQGEWASKLPGEFERWQAGAIPLFEDDRIAWGLAELGGVVGQNVLELGPLEGGHSYMLEQAGAASVTAIEANTRAYLKCLITKEILGLKRTRFLCGDFTAYLRRDPPRFDLVLASGVLYHMRNPVELIDRLAAITDRLLVWTHYFDGEIIRNTPHLQPKFPSATPSVHAGFAHVLHRYEYTESLNHQGFCGGSASYSHWLSRDDLLAAFERFGFKHLTIHMETPEFVNGPCLTLAARK